MQDELREWGWGGKQSKTNSKPSKIGDGQGETFNHDEEVGEAEQGKQKYQHSVIRRS